MSIFVMVRLYLISINQLSMKNLLLLTLFITFILQGCGGELVYNKEEPFIERGGQNGMKYKGEFYSGKYIHYHDDGTLSKVREKGSYNNGQMDGVWEYYYKNGQLWWKRSYLNGKEDGVLEEYHENGKPNVKGSYLNGERNGVWESYHDNGQLSGKGSYLNGEKIGVWEEYHENGQLWRKGSYLNGERDGVCEVYYSNGKLWEKGSHLNGNMNGVWERYYHKNGKLKEKGSYLSLGLGDGYKKIGVWEYYKEDGSLRLTETY